MNKLTFNAACATTSISPSCPLNGPCSYHDTLIHTITLRLASISSHAKSHFVVVPIISVKNFNPCRCPFSFAHSHSTLISFFTSHSGDRVEAGPRGASGAGSSILLSFVSIVNQFFDRTGISAMSAIQGLCVTYHIAQSDLGSQCGAHVDVVDKISLLTTRRTCAASVTRPSTILSVSHAHAEKSIPVTVAMEPSKKKNPRKPRERREVRPTKPRKIWKPRSDIQITAILVSLHLRFRAKDQGNR